jgi:hypothetical protein
MTSIHAPPQYMVPAGHAMHVPWLQVGADAGQTFPQAPQLCASEFRDVQVPLQQVVPAAQQV